MKPSKKLVFCLMLCGLTVLLPSRAKAVTDDDKKFLATAAQSDVNEIKLSQLAEKKATNPAVKSFARRMVTDHTRLSASMKPFASSWGLTPPTDMDNDHQQEYQKLSGLSGADFDKEYMDQMASDHAKALDLFTEEGKNTQDTKFRAAVLKAKTTITAHKNMADNLQKRLQ